MTGPTTKPDPDDAQTPLANCRAVGPLCNGRLHWTAARSVLIQSFFDPQLVVRRAFALGLGLTLQARFSSLQYSSRNYPYDYGRRIFDTYSKCAGLVDVSCAFRKNSPLSVAVEDRALAPTTKWEGKGNAPWLAFLPPQRLECGNNLASLPP